MKSLLSILVGIVVNLQFITAQSIQQLDWKSDSKVEAITYKGREAIRVGPGLSYLPSPTLQDGVVEVDVANEGAVMSGIVFRLNENNLFYENIYIRHPKSGLADAIQYTPAFNGEFNWQAYKEYQATEKFIGDWIHLKIVFKEGRAAIFMKSDTATLYIDSLRTGQTEGKIGLWSLTGSYFSNFKFSSSSTPILYKTKPIQVVNPKAIRNWRVSEPMVYNPDFVKNPDWKIVDELSYTETTVEPDGLLNIGRYAKKKIFGKTRNNSTDVVWLTYSWNEESIGLRSFNFEFISLCSIYINSEPIFTGNNSFLAKGSLYRGDIDKTLHCNSIFLPVKSGVNTLKIAVASTTNGWAFMGQIIK